MHVFSKPMHPSDILHIAAELRTLMLPEISALMAEQKPDIKDIVREAVREATSSLTAELHSVKTENIELKSSCNELRQRLTRLELENDALEQYGRRNIIRVSGIQEQNNEDTDDIVLQLANDLDVPMTKQDIDRSHRVGKLDTRNQSGRAGRAKKPVRDIIVKFSTYNARHRLFQKRKALRETDSELLKSVYLNEDLTKFRSEILFEARSLRRARKLNSAYSSDGKLFVRDLEDRRYQISSLDDLVKFGYTRKPEHGRSVGPQPSTSGVGSVEY